MCLTVTLNNAKNRTLLTKTIAGEHHMKRQRLVLFMLAAVSLSLSAFSQTDDETRLTLDRIFKNREFVSEFFGPARWLSDGATYTTVEASDAVKGARDILKYDTETGKREVLVSAAKLIPPGESTPLRIDDYSWALGPCHRHLVVQPFRVRGVVLVAVVHFACLPVPFAFRYVLGLRHLQ